MHNSTEKPAHLLHIFPYYCPPEGTESGGGTKTAMLTILQGLNKKKYHNLILLPAPSCQYDKSFLEAGANELVYLNDYNFLAFEFPRLRHPFYLPMYSGRLIRNIVRICTIIRKKKIDIVHSHATSFLGAAIAAKICKTPCVMHVHEYPFNFPRVIRRIYQRIICRFSNRVLCCADFIRQGFIEANCPCERVRTIYNAVNPAAFRLNKDKSLRSELDIEDNHWVIGFVGRLAPRKGVEYFLQAAKKILSERKDVVFIIAGDNHAPTEQDYKQSIFAMADGIELKGKVHFLGVCSDVAVVYSAMDILIFPSPQDIGPYVPLEAMASGVPVVSASEGGAVEEVENGVTGIHVSPRDAEGISHAVLKLMAEPEQVSKMSLAARWRVERLFNRNRYAKDVEQVYEELLGKIDETEPLAETQHEYQVSCKS